ANLSSLAGAPAAAIPSGPPSWRASRGPSFAPAFQPGTARPRCPRTYEAGSARKQAKEVTRRTAGHSLACRGCPRQATRRPGPIYARQPGREPAGG
ncbi:unnamed protein product, partial [Amoebophrya sp. A120]